MKNITESTEFITIAGIRYRRVYRVEGPFLRADGKGQHRCVFSGWVVCET